jgi:hypothetical protein
MREPVFIIHADIISKKVYWAAPQLDRHLAATLQKTDQKSITLRIPTGQQSPPTAADLLLSLDKIYLALANRELTSASMQSFAESLQHMPNQEALHRAFQKKNDTLRLQRIRDLIRARNLGEARPRSEAILSDPDSDIETKFWAELQLEGIDFSEAVRSGKPQSEIPKVFLTRAQALKKLTASGPKHLRFYAIIAEQAARLAILTHENSSLFMAMHQHLEHHGNPMFALGIYAQRAVLTKNIFQKYNQCVRLARFAVVYPNRWILGRALSKVVHAVARYLITLQFEGNISVYQNFAKSALQICKLAVWISGEIGDSEGIVMVVISALTLTGSTDSEAYSWAKEIAQNLSDPAAKEDAENVIKRAEMRWRGDHVEGDYHGDPIWQIIQNISTSMGIDLSNENDPLVQGLRIAARDDNPENVLRNCENLLVSLGATGPTARRVQQIFNISTAGSKVVHCTLHSYHVEAKEHALAYEEFNKRYCDSCPDKKPRPAEWRYQGVVRQEFETRHFEFLKRLAGKPFGFRYTDED